MRKKVHFESGEIELGDVAEEHRGEESTALTLLDNGSVLGGGAGKEKENSKEAYDPLKDPNLTASERKFLETQRNRYSKLADKVFKMTHRQRIEKFNTMLSKLSEHHDVPKVGNAGMG
jgi:hypothetical protein